MLYKGIAVSGGIAIGTVYKPKLEYLGVGRDQVDDPAAEIVRFEVALKTAQDQLTRLIEKLKAQDQVTESQIVETQLMMYDDSTLNDGVREAITKEKCSAEFAVSLLIDHYVATFSNMEDEYLRGRVADVRDMGERLLRILMGKRERRLDRIKERLIIVAHELSPSDAAQLDPKKILGLAIDVGSTTSHTAIISRALEIPAVVGLGNFSRLVENDDVLILDGRNGLAILNPVPELIRRYKKVQKNELAKSRSLAKLRKLPAETKDGFQIELAANIELLSEIDTVSEHGAQGIGLYRTEFLYLNRDDIPDETEQFEAYTVVARQLAPQPVVIRTVDIGGDKFLSHPDVPVEMNPYLGCRAIRFSLERPDTFKVQLRAILRASASGNVRLMFPMISSLQELRRAKVILEECREELRQEGHPFDPEMEVGIMVEVPSTATLADLFAREVDFFSIGTNDLIQYTLAVDRGNQAIADLYEPFHPAVLRLLRRIVTAGHNAGIWVGLCGQMAAMPLAIPYLIGLGIDELSTSPVDVPITKATIRAINFSEASELAAELINLATAEEIKQRLHAAVPEEIKRYIETEPIPTESEESLEKQA
jgi:phosphotransferase system enzyme I (PtsI)